MSRTILRKQRDQAYHGSLVDQVRLEVREQCTTTNDASA